MPRMKHRHRGFPISEQEQLLHEGGIPGKKAPLVKKLVIGLVGNPNSGKTTIFNALTGARQKVANWSGVTVEKREGHLRHGDYSIRVVDLPGIYSLTSYTIEEIITRDFILTEKPDIIINVVDSGNLERNLYLTTQLINIKATVVLALNMFDEATSKGMEIDTGKLGQLLGMPVVQTVGNRGLGITELLDAAVQVRESRELKSRYINIPLPADVETEVRAIQDVISQNNEIAEIYSTRWLAIRLLENDTDAEKKTRYFSNCDEILNRVIESREKLEKRYNDEIETIISDARYGFINGAIRETVTKKPLQRIDTSERIDRIVTNRFLGFPLLFIFLWALFHLTFALGEYPMRLIENGVHRLGGLAVTLLPPGPLTDLLTGGIIDGVGSVIVFLPNILILFMGISFMEDTGYMARAAFIMDRIMHTMGLHGKSFIPLVMGFGCNVPAIMTTRSLENRQDRILTILINPFMSCSARLPVYILFAGTFFHTHAGTVILLVYLTGILLAFLSARLHKVLFFKGASTPFVMELPPYRIPTLKSVLLHMWDRGSQYLKKMGGIILAFSVIIWVLGEYPKSAEIEKRYSKESLSLKQEYDYMLETTRKRGSADAATLREEFQNKKAALDSHRNAEEREYAAIGRIGKLIEPAISPLGFSWQMGVSLVSGFVAKEIVVSTLGVLYQVSQKDQVHDVSLEKELVKPKHGITPLVALTFMLFVLLYVPCLATIAVIGREAGWRWAAFSIVYQMIVAWLVCFVFYNIGMLFV